MWAPKGLHPHTYISATWQKKKKSIHESRSHLPHPRQELVDMTSREQALPPRNTSRPQASNQSGSVGVIVIAVLTSLPEQNYGCGYCLPHFLWECTPVNLFKIYQFLMYILIFKLFSLFNRSVMYYFFL